MEMDLFHLMDDPEGPTLHAIALFVALLCACIVVGHHLEKNRWVNDSIIALGIVSSSISHSKQLVQLCCYDIDILLLIFVFDWLLVSTYCGKTLIVDDCLGF